MTKKSADLLLLVYLRNLQVGPIKSIPKNDNKKIEETVKAVTAI